MLPILCAVAFCKDFAVIWIGNFYGGMVIFVLLYKALIKER